MARSIEFLRPGSLDEAVAMLNERGEDAKVIAGSTAVTIMLRERLIDPGALVWIGRLPEAELHGIDHSGGELRIGALVTHREVERDETVKSVMPVVAQTFGKVANVRVRNQATVGGVLAEADYASDPPALMLALDAEVDMRGPSGTRSVPMSEFTLSFYTTALEPNEIVTGVRVPVPPAGTHAVYHKFVTRSSEDRPCVGVAGVVRLAGDGRTAEDVRVAVGAAAEIPQRFRDLEAVLLGKELDDAAIRSIAEGYAERIDTLDDMRGSSWYRSQMVRVWVRRALEDARSGAIGGASQAA
jgi:carbon-monoxide dehydrogenase medium subunit